MHIAQLAPLWETVPPKSYGGTELVVYLLTEELIRQGHEVTLFTVGASQSSAKQEFCIDFSLRDLPERYPAYLEQKSAHKGLYSLYPGSPISTFYELELIEKVFSQAHRFDIIHNHLGFLVLPFAALTETPMVTTLHGAFRPDIFYDWVMQQFAEYYRKLPFVSISDEQRQPCPALNYVATIYHGLDIDQYQPSYSTEDKEYLTFLGRFCPDKGPQHAIRIARETGWKLIMAGKVDSLEEQEFFAAEIEPHIDGRQIQYVGELNHPQKVHLLRHAAATLCPVTWREPFGLVLIESMACGTPVLALKNGSIPEIVVDQETGFVVDTVEELIQRVSDISSLDRQACRAHVKARFSVERMTQDYLQIYESLLKQHASQPYSMSEGSTRLKRPSPNVAILSSKERVIVHS